MNVSASALVDVTAECSNEKETMDIREQSELSVSTLLMHFANEFDPYGALSTPLYQTATFKQT
ncbi:cystathionine beta-lyase [Dorcoceras hygrometricum]|nr:cystathionine beta-lyase [Dorcoceras hygrometricum]